MFTVKKATAITAAAPAVSGVMATAAPASAGVRAASENVRFFNEHWRDNSPRQLWDVTPSWAVGGVNADGPGTLVGAGPVRLGAPGPGCTDSSY